MRLTIALIPFVFTSCLPKLLVPHDFSIAQNNDEAYVEVDSISVSLVNLEVNSDHYVFGMEVQNHSDQPVFIDLEQIRKYAHHLSYQDEEAKEFQEITIAMTPDKVKRFFKKKQQNAQAAAAFLFFVGAAISTYDAIKDEQDNRKSSWTEKDEKKSIGRDIATATTLLATDILTEAALQSKDAASTELRYLPAELFDKKVIYPGESYYGKVLFRRIAEVKNYHRITFPHEGKRFHFDFRKATYKEREFLFGRDR